MFLDPSSTVFNLDPFKYSNFDSISTNWLPNFSTTNQTDCQQIVNNDYNSSSKITSNFERIETDRNQSTSKKVDVLPFSSFEISSQINNNDQAISRLFLDEIF